MSVQPLDDFLILIIFFIAENMMHHIRIKGRKRKDPLKKKHKRESQYVKIIVDFDKVSIWIL